MNQAQRQLVWSGAVAAALLGVAAAKELSKPGFNCKAEIYGFIDRRGRSVIAKAQDCN
jgi:hypothetical protein